MDAFLTRLREGAERYSEVTEKRRFVMSFKAYEHQPVCKTVKLNYSAVQLLEVTHRILREQQFDCGDGADYQRKTVHASFRREYSPRDEFLNEFANMGNEPLTLGFRVEATTVTDGLRITVSHSFPTWLQSFVVDLRSRLAATPPGEFDQALMPSESSQTTSSPAQGTRILGPGEPITGSVRGYFRDYSGFASEGEVRDLSIGDLPLGRYCFQKSGTEPAGSRLYLSRYRTGAPMVHNGVLVCAPQGSGKTELILRWAEAANKRGDGVFIIDMKGNMHEKLEGRLRGTVRYFTTDPHVHDCDGINFIAGLHGTTPIDSMRVRQIAEALLPREGWEEGEQAYFHQNHVNWLSGLLQLLLLYARAVPQHFRSEPTLADLYELAADEQSLLKLLRNLKKVDARHPLPAPGLGYWLREIALLLAPDHPETPAAERLGGQRSRDYEYRTLTQSAVNALRPFSRFGTLYAKTGGPQGNTGPGRLFELSQLENSGPDGPVTIILAARIQDLDDARTVTSLAVQRLQHMLFERMSPTARQGISRAHPAPSRSQAQPTRIPQGKPHPVLLLLDETRRIPGFKANEYVTFAREAQAGCVVSYQSLDQIGEAAQISEMLENVGTQVYLGSLVGATAKYFIDLLPVRHRRRYSWSTSTGSSYSEGIDSNLEEVPYVGTNELYSLPGGKWPALVYINAQPRRKPFLVDLDSENP